MSRLAIKQGGLRALVRIQNMPPLFLMGHSSILLSIMVLIALRADANLIPWAIAKVVLSSACLAWNILPWHRFFKRTEVLGVLLVLDSMLWGAMLFTIAQHSNFALTSTSTCLSLTAVATFAIRRNALFYLAYVTCLALPISLVLIESATPLGYALLMFNVMFVALALVMDTGHEDKGSSPGKAEATHSATPQVRHLAANYSEFHIQGSFRLLASLHQELRRPLHAILGLAEQVKAEGQSPLAIGSDRIDAMSKSGHQLLDILDDAHDLCLAETGEFAPTPAPFDLSALVISIAEEANASALRPAGASLTLINQLATRQFVQGDEARIKRLLHRLLNHVGQACRDQAIVMEAWQLQDPARCMMFEFEVQGFIKASVEANLSTQQSAGNASAKRIPTSPATSHQLDLGIIELLARSLNGSLEVLRELDQISYLLRIPMAAAAPQALVRPIPSGIEDCYDLMRGLHILIAEDHAMNAQLLIEQLRARGAQVTHVLNGKDALETVMLPTRPDLVLMDCQMPVMDGFEAASCIRAEEQQKGWSCVPIVALTALTMSSEREHCIAVGMNAHLVKPFTTAELAKAIWDVLPINQLTKIA